MGGFLADPANTLPGLFGQGSIFGFQWLQDYPYALPSLLNALFLAVVTGLVFLFLEEASISYNLRTVSVTNYIIDLQGSCRQV